MTLLIIAIILLVAGVFMGLVGIVSCMDPEGRGGSFVKLIYVGGIVAVLAFCWLVCIFVRWLLV